MIPTAHPGHGPFQTSEAASSLSGDPDGLEILMVSNRRAVFEPVLAWLGASDASSPVTDDSRP